MTTTSPLAALPLDPAPDGGPSPELVRRLRAALLDEVRMPSGQNAVLGVAHADARQVLTDPRFSRELSYEGAPGFFPGEDATTADPDFLANMPDRRHALVRRIVAGAFSARRVASWRPVTERIAAELVQELKESGAPLDFVSQFGFRLPIRVICEIIGITGEDQERFRSFTTAAFAADGAGFLTYIEDLLKRRRAEPGTDLIDDLIQARDGKDRLTEPELVRLVLALIVAGHETTAAALSRGTLSLLAEPERYRRLVEEPGRIPAAVEEILRLNPPVDTSLLRVATEDVELASGTVGRGSAVLASLTGANVDPAVFEEPHSFSLDREPSLAREHLTFGHGAHFCLGAGVARLELTVALEVLTANLPGLRLAVDPEKVHTVSDLMVRTLPELPVRW
ncbi:cytochrome P450 [Streptomyces sp. RKAG290]|uniref:cytochrome P450 n=1 Tax=Streptomyces sp. RKAG290 TaxID=2888348 RepID=UPI002033DB72|nr:cytochrome P450 [Streptomyces sp. RKAG290]MCM2410698.1 cytochrome P450 [Streptomyces sp. RKAG290]